MQKMWSCVGGKMNREQFALRYKRSYPYWKSLHPRLTPEFLYERLKEIGLEPKGV